jgi:hypothetical protein
MEIATVHHSPVTLTPDDDAMAGPLACLLRCQPEMPDPEPISERLPSVSAEEAAVIGQVIQMLRRIKLGTVVIVVQDGKVVQIEMAEKFRLR